MSTLTRRLARRPAATETLGATGSSPSTVRVAADETVEVSLTVNGNPAVLNLAPRVTLADALRDHLGLTGTHLGCEHGVCGMCTVLVDGEAARACLLFAVQTEGAEVVTVEGLGRPDDLHPLQEAFGRHHGLQCGFCTPGMLLSAYDLLDHQPGVTEEELPEQMSGVLCRCTGYRNILDAVSDVASCHPDGIPGPKNCGTSKLLGRPVAGGTSSAAAASAAAAATSAAPVEIRLPSSAPTVSVDVSSDVDVPPEQVWKVMDDVERLARCLPGAELTDDLGNDMYKGRARVALGPIRLSFVGDVHVVERDPVSRRLRALGQAADTGGGRVQADIRLSVEPLGEGSRLRANAGVHLTGRIAQFGRSLADDVSRNMFEQFAAALAATARGEEPAAAGKPPSVFTLLAQLVASRARAAVRRLRRKGRHADR
jgi:xanthine dehydrogenase YagT iron-sulfur-binding subunit